MRPVRGTWAFWHTVDAIPPGDAKREEIYDIAFAFGEQGPDIEGSRTTMHSFGMRWRPGYWVDLPSGEGFVGYLAIEDVDGTALIAMVHLVWF